MVVLGEAIDDEDIGIGCEGDDVAMWYLCESIEASNSET